MNFTETDVPGLFLIEAEPYKDARGFFARVYSPEDFGAKGLETNLNQCSLSYNAATATLRGMHFQIEPHAETKLVRCIRGKIFDVVVDLRKESPAYLKYVAVELGDDPCQALYIPKGCAHGFLTLTKNAQILYQIGGAYAPTASRGLRYDDPLLGISWPCAPKVISEKDLSYPLLSREELFS